MNDDEITSLTPQLPKPDPVAKRIAAMRSERISQTAPELLKRIIENEAAIKHCMAHAKGLAGEIDTIIQCNTHHLNFIIGTPHQDTRFDRSDGKFYVKGSVPTGDIPFQAYHSPAVGTLFATTQEEQDVLSGKKGFDSMEEGNRWRESFVNAYRDKLRGITEIAERIQKLPAIAKKINEQQMLTENERWLIEHAAEDTKRLNEWHQAVSPAFTTKHNQDRQALEKAFASNYHDFPLDFKNAQLAIREAAALELMTNEPIRELRTTEKPGDKVIDRLIRYEMGSSAREDGAKTPEKWSEFVKARAELSSEWSQSPK